MIRRKTSELLIRPRMSVRQRLALALLIAIIVITSLYGTYKFGVRSVEANFINNEARIGELEQDVSNMNQTNSELHTDLALAERQKQIQAQAYKEVSDAYAGVVEKNEFLNRRLDFYRSIISPEDGKAGVKIHDFEIKYAFDDVTEETKLLFDLTLVQSIRHNINVRADVVIGVYRKTDKQNPIVVWPEQDSKAVNFKYYEKISGELVVAKLNQLQAEELELKVDVKIRGENSGDVAEWYPLPSVEVKNKIM